METAGTTREQVRKRALGRRPRLSAAAWTQARRHLTRPVRAGADAGVSGTWPRASVPAWPELAPGKRLHPGGLSLARLGGQRRGCRIPDGLAESQAPGRGRSRFSAIPGHRVSTRGPVWGGRPWESARPPAGQPWRGQLRTRSLAVFPGI